MSVILTQEQIELLTKTAEKVSEELKNSSCSRCNNSINININVEEVVKEDPNILVERLKKTLQRKGVI